MINRRFRLLFAGQSVSVIGDALFPVAPAFAVLDELDGTPAQLGIVLAAQTLPLAVLILAAGVWADRVNRRNVMLASDVGRAAVQAALAALLITDTAQLWHVVALGVPYGIFDAGFQPAAGGLVLMPIGFALVAPAAELIGTRTTMVVSALLVIALFLLALATGDVRRLTAP